MCDCHNSIEEHEVWLKLEHRFWASEYRRTKKEDIEICRCGHGIEWHKHVEECRHGDCVFEMSCKSYIPI